MSSIAGNGGGGAAAATATPNFPNYFCYQCERSVSITPSPSSDLVCPTCNGGFLEEIENPNPNSSNPNINNPFLSSSDGISGIPLLFSSSFNVGGGGGGAGGMDPLGEIDLGRLFGFVAGGGGGGGGASDGRRSSATSGGIPQPEAFNPFNFLQGYFQNLRANGTNIQVVIDNNTMDIGEGLFGGRGGGFGFPAILGDYAIGPGLEQLMQQLAENDPNRYGTPPASKSAVEGLPDLKITKELLESDSSQCAVCKDEFELGVDAKQMPCKHIYHPDCIIPWLELHNSCPVCRYELPTDDPDYENRGDGNQGSGNRPAITVALGNSGGSGGATQQGSSPSPRTVERRFSISLPWPFRGISAPAETSNANTNSRSNNSEPNSADHSGPNPGNEPREPGLD